jgi:uncharacterized protein YecE (DUF72 family)
LRSEPQLALFSAEAGRQAIAAAEVPEAARALAARLPHGLRFGTMSWAYPGWVGRVYAGEATEKALTHGGLPAYAQHPLLRAVELDRSFYESLPAEVYAALGAQLPADFRFVAKAHRDCTAVVQGNGKLLDASFASDMVVAPFVEGLREKAGAVVFQFSPFQVRSPQRFAAMLHEFLARLPRGPVYAVELRNEELLTPAYGEALAAAGAVHCFNVWGRMPPVLEQRERLPAAAWRVGVVRWLHRPGATWDTARERFSPFSELRDEDLERRGQIATLVRGAEGFVLVGNTAEGCAPESIVRLAEAIAR